MVLVYMSGRPKGAKPRPPNIFRLAHCELTLFNATEGLVQCYRGSCSLVERVLFNATEGLVHGYRGSCSRLERVLLTAREGLVQWR